VSSWADSDELEWARANCAAEKRHPDKVVSSFDDMVKYTNHNKRGVSVQNGLAFYDNKLMTLPVMAEYGGM
jgi:hypothetical protein